MLRRNRKIIMTVAAAAAMFLNVALSSVNNVSAASPRLWGQDRYETAVEVSKEGWTSSDYVVLASGEGYADALCAAPLAKKYNAPILLTESKSLNSKTKQEIQRLNAKHILIVGKYGSVSQEAEQELSSLAGDVKRLGGNDRYETSVIVAKELGSVDKVVVTSGSGFADALSIAPIAAGENMPILLAGKESLSEQVQDYLNENKNAIKSFYIIGGEASISNETANQISISAVRLGGANRFETNLNVMKYFKDKIKFDSIYVVQADGPTGKEFADALSGAALATKTASPVILSYNTISSEVQSFIKENMKEASIITALGGVTAVPETVITKLQGAAAPTTTDPDEINGEVVSGGGGGGGTTTNNDLDEATKQKLKGIVTQLNTLKSKLKYQSEKAVVEDMVEAINNTLSDSSYDYKSEASKVKEKYNALSSDEKSDFITQAMKYMDTSQLLALKSQFGM